ncbi:cell death regulator Aven isoform X2 [Paroedura picta]|uniref:cell death regulator Aven isoform X2 n=1 Tax=Paroedura picta TaxID=143630 RepID=UPI004056DF85
MPLARRPKPGALSEKELPVSRRRRGRHVGASAGLLRAASREGSRKCRLSAAAGPEEEAEGKLGGGRADGKSRQKAPEATAKTAMSGEAGAEEEAEDVAGETFVAGELLCLPPLLIVTSRWDSVWYDGEKRMKNWFPGQLPSWKKPSTVGSATTWTTTADLELQEEEKEEQGSYSRRKVVSNWHRYEDTEKETQSDSSESQRGTDFSVLLSSAGDSFTQFRFVEEKEWITENLCTKQLPGFYADCQSLVKAFEELPLHLKLNVAADLVQDAVPVTLPPIKSKSNDVSKRSNAQLQQLVGQSPVVPSNCSATVSAAQPNKDEFEIISSEDPQKSPVVSDQGTNQLDKDLDLLLKLDAPVDYETSSVLKAMSHAEEFEEDLKMSHEENVFLEPEPGGKSAVSQQQQVVSKSITEEDLEDWLDSMIS